MEAFALSGRLVDCMFNPGCCPGLRASALSGRMASRQNCKSGETSPLAKVLSFTGVPADLQSAVKKVRPIKTGGFVIPQQKERHSPLLRIANPQSRNRLGHFLTPDYKSGGTPSRLAFLIKRSITRNKKQEKNDESEEFNL